MSNDPDPERVQEAAEHRRQERAETTEHILDRVDGLVTRLDYPTTSEEIAMEYGDERIDLPNETESLGSVFDRMAGEQFESPEEAREAIYGEITGEAGPSDEYNDQRDLEELDENADSDVTESGASDM